MKPAGRAAVLALCVVASACSGSGFVDRGDAVRVEFVGSARPAIFFLELADDDGERARGLMSRTSLPPNGGMLFVWPDAAPRSFWMKSTVIPLDLVVVRARRVVATHRLEPCPQDPCPSTRTAAADAAVEVLAGTVARLGIREGLAVSALPDVLRAA